MSRTVGKSSLRTVLLGMAALLVIAIGAPAAQARTIGGLPCSGQQLSQPFAHWGDFSSYYLVPGGSFEPGSLAWTTTGGAKVAAGNEPWHVSGGAGSHSLVLPAGSSATSPQTCVSLGSPTIRFFVHSSGTSLLSSLRVNVLFARTAGILNTLPIGVVLPSSSWEPSPPYLFVANLLTLLGPNYRMVGFQFTPQGTGTWQVDDVYIDPWSKG